MKILILQFSPNQNIQETSEETKQEPTEDVKVEKTEPPKQPEEPEKVFSPPPPVTSLPREITDTSTQSSNKFRKPKPAPRLNVSRSTQKVNVSCLTRFG